MRKNSDEDTYFKPYKSIVVRQKLLEFTDNRVMGILNVTPDSFFSGSRVRSESEILAKAEQMLNEGADLLDIGGYSSRPGASDVSISEETERISFATRLIRNHFPEAILSLDTFRSSVAEVGLGLGIDMINDVSAGNLDPKLPEIVAKFKVPYLIMHMRGTPQNMKNLTQYDFVMKDIIFELSKKINKFKALGINDIIIDPGIGFAKTIHQNFEIIRNLSMLKILDCPILVGISRKSFIQKTLDVTPEDSVLGTNVLHTLLLQNGANILRTHDVAETKQTLALLKAVEKL